MSNWSQDRHIRARTRLRDHPTHGMDPGEQGAALDRIEELMAERDRLDSWLARIEGGDCPCDDAGQLRRWAYEAGLGHEVPND